MIILLGAVAVGVHHLGSLQLLGLLRLDVAVLVAGIDLLLLGCE